MKKAVARLAVLLLLVMQLTGVVYALDVDVTAKEGLTVVPFDASGAEMSGTGTIQDPEYFKITYENSAILEGEQYAILLVSADLSGTEPVYEMSDENIKYLGQTAGKAGSVQFDKVYPSEICDSVVLISGEGLESPYPAGTIKTGQSSPGFVDVPENAFYAKAVAWAVAKNVTKGTSDTTFSPQDPCTRAQMVTFLWRAKGSPTPKTTENKFTDVKSDKYYYEAVLWAVENNITNGISETQFGPDNSVTRAQTVTFLWRMEGSEPVSADNPFLDVPAGMYYTDAVLWAVKHEITNGMTPTEFAPNGVCNRGQIVTFLYRDLA